jgi:MbtH protein
VVNHEEQYSIWPEYKEIPKGWRAVGKTGQMQECLDYIKEVWDDMRPLSLRKAMATHKKSPNSQERDIGADQYESLAAF